MDSAKFEKNFSASLCVFAHKKAKRDRVNTLSPTLLFAYSTEITK